MAQLNVTPASDALAADPCPTYKALRDATSLHFYVGANAVLLSRYEDDEAAATYPKLFVDIAKRERETDVHHRSLL